MTIERTVVGLALALVACSAGGANRTAGDDLTRADLPVPIAEPPVARFVQAIDHDADVGTFAQRYWVVRDYATAPNAPVILALCGEDACSWDYATFLGDTAKTLGATIVLLEHRYYGESVPYPDRTLEHMRLLSIHQALEDAATFQAFATRELGLAGKWIVTGASYSGMLAAYYREKHPELVVGAWASSAPVDVEKSFIGYDRIAARALGPECNALFRVALASAERLYDDPATHDAFVHDVIDEDPDVSKEDALYDFSGIAMDAAQYGEQRGLCAALAQHRDAPIEGVRGYLDPALVHEPGDDAGAPPTNDADAAAPGDGGAVESSKRRPHFPRLRRPARDDFSGSEWLYQVCTELGLYQVANPDVSESIMSPLMTEAYWDRSCLAATGQLPDTARTKAEYFDPIARGEVTNLYFVNGSLDPWRALSVVSAAHLPGGDAFLVAEGSHCEDWDNLSDTSLTGVFESHVRFADLAKRWLAVP